MVSKSGNQKGGGYGTRQHVEKPVRIGKGSYGTRPGGAASLGQVYGNHVTNRDHTGYRGPKFHTDQVFHSGVKYGNEKALDVGGGGPGTGRTIYEHGTQCQTGTNPGNPRPNPRREALEQE
jgi:hypothetical protein